MQVKLGFGTHLSRQVPTTKGLKQGCVLAPILFNLYMADLTPALDSCNCHAPRLGRTPLSSFLYADDVVLVSHTQVGLQHLLDELYRYVKENLLEVVGKGPW